MRELIPGRGYDEQEIRRALGAPDSSDPFVLGSEGTALIASLDGEEPLELTDRATVRWPGRAPQHIVAAGAELLVFVERGDSIVFLGTGSVASYSSRLGQPADVRFALRPTLERVLWLELVAGAEPSLAVEPFPEASLCALGAASTAHDRWVALTAFIEGWHGVEIEELPDRQAAIGPALLHDLLAVSDVIPDLFGFNQLVAAEDLEVDDGKLVFLVENQGVCLWATEPAGDDPRVWYRNNDEGEPWLEEPARLSSFVIQAVLFEAIMHARFGGMRVAAPADEVKAVLDRVDALDAECWNWCGGRFFARDGALVMTTENEGATDIWLAAATPLALERFADLDTDEWERAAF